MDYPALQLELPGVLRSDSLSQALSWMMEDLTCKGPTRLMHASHCRYLLAYFGDIPVRSIDYALLRDYATSETRRGLSAETVRKRLYTAKMALEAALYHRELDRLPHFPVLKQRRHPKQGYWTRLQWEAAHMACDADDDLRIWIAVDWWTGMHNSDINRFRWQDIDLVAKRWVRRNTKVQAEPKVLPLPERFWKILKERYEQRQPHPRDLVCGRDLGNPNREIREIARRAGIPEISPIEVGRHSCETYLEECGTDELFQMTWLGLKSPAMLKKHYRHATDVTVQRGIAAIDAM